MSLGSVENTAFSEHYGLPRLYNTEIPLSALWALNTVVHYITLSPCDERDITLMPILSRIPTYPCIKKFTKMSKTDLKVIRHQTEKLSQHMLNYHLFLTKVSQALLRLPAEKRIS